MAARCQVTGVKPRYQVPSLGRSVTLTLSVKGIKTIDKQGIDAVVARMRAQGVRF